MEKRIALESKCLHMMNPSLRIDQNKLYSIKLTRSNILETGSLELTKKKNVNEAAYYLRTQGINLESRMLKNFQRGKRLFPQVPTK